MDMFFSECNFFRNFYFIPLHVLDLLKTNTVVPVISANTKIRTILSGRLLGIHFLCIQKEFAVAVLVMMVR